MSLRDTERSSGEVKSSHIYFVRRFIANRKVSTFVCYCLTIKCCVFKRTPHGLTTLAQEAEQLCDKKQHL